MNRPKRFEETTVLAEGSHSLFMRRGYWEYLARKEISGIVGMIPVTDDGRLVLVEQYRPPVDARVVEIPAGLVGDEEGRRDEPLVEAAGRELIEETGYRAARLKAVCTGVPSAGGTAETLTIYLATGLQRVGPGGGDDSEEIDVHEVPLAELGGWLDRRRREGVLVDLKIYAALHFIEAEGLFPAG
jgi:ADP-ribose pyrophosphatase